MKTKRTHSVAAVVLTVLTLVVTAGCTGLQGPARSAAPIEIRDGRVVGYLPAESLPDSMSLLPPPPAPDSAAFVHDEEASLAARTLQGTARWSLAARDADLQSPAAPGAFSCALGIPITATGTPHLFRLMWRCVADAASAIRSVKEHYRRIRPFVVNGAPICTPEAKAHLSGNGSYPSAHTTIGWSWSLVLAEIAPERADAILSRGLAYGENRIVCNVHWLSDVQAGLVMGAAVAARLHADPAFRADLEAARAEITALRAQGVKPTDDCRAEAAALAIKPPPLGGIPVVRRGETVTYRCEGGAQITAAYYHLADESLRFVRLRMPDGREFTLPQGLSASGARYTDEAEWVWWIKGESARLETRRPDGEWRLMHDACSVRQ